MPLISPQVAEVVVTVSLLAMGASICIAIIIAMFRVSFCLIKDTANEMFGYNGLFKNSMFSSLSKYVANLPKELDRIAMAMVEISRQLERLNVTMKSINCIESARLELSRQIKEQNGISLKGVKK